ncbi:hypothetical protein MUK42_35878 [Musa troglodytarum]|uniref:Uncharacterized protein n=1 Tax=Musa troglodytarum TaxID=320322 RepID=A0A9E7KCP1_9LILI|nr:hypothetical protein MUK42_35878 [Musa troglodytarum]
MPNGLVDLPQVDSHLNWPRSNQSWRLGGGASLLVDGSSRVRVGFYVESNMTGDCKSENSELSSQEKSDMIHGELAKTPGVVSDSLHHTMNQNLLRKDDITKEIDSDNCIKEQSSHDIASTKNGTVLHSQKQHETTPERGVTGKTPISIMPPFEEDTLDGTDKSQQSCTGEEAFPDNMQFL